ncbi:hypothetical protein NNJEOMEG_01733 [Fundidesulfovibrio magnetotacticus]|uniref:Exosortase n=1 Tax=Fundidesulfovibrio magnetotacticus TaxID=2730080 RepID=A0A6V8M094_9BACT|nr:exosortase/archaeosortase family protein [Fundidesulfovibrio magnetotacticus]GFK93895.1 hypothetical protein NNJEOMEG_01733 [Fundidesulfovibrio magnetotacticus]
MEHVGTISRGEPPLALQDALRRSWPWLLALLLILGLVFQDIVAAMVRVWADDENNSHGFLVPLVSLYLIATRRDRLATAQVTPCAWGLWISVLGVVMLLAGWVSTEFFTMRASLVVILYGTVLYWYGWEVMRLLGGPLLYLLLMIPVPAVVYDALAMPLRGFVTMVSVWIMKSLGVLVLREGNVMLFPNITLEVVNACSGLRSLTSLLALAVAFALLFQKSAVTRWILALLALPIAVITNIGRVVATGVLSQYFGAAAAEGFFHEFAGMVIFITALALLFAAHLVLRRFDS